MRLLAALSVIALGLGLNQPTAIARNLRDETIIRLGDAYCKMLEENPDRSDETLAGVLIAVFQDLGGDEQDAGVLTSYLRQSCPLSRLDRIFQIWYEEAQRSQPQPPQ